MASNQEMPKGTIKNILKRDVPSLSSQRPMKGAEQDTFKQATPYDSHTPWEKIWPLQLSEQRPECWA